MGGFFLELLEDHTCYVKISPPQFSVKFSTEGEQRTTKTPSVLILTKRLMAYHTL